MELNTIQNKSNWGKATESINTNFAHVGSEIDKLKYAAYNSKLYPSLEILQQEKPNPSVGDWAIVGDTIPGAIYRCSTEGVWSATGETGGGYGMNVTETNVTENNHYGDIINNPDDEDLTEETNENEEKVIKLADKEYNAAGFSGLGRVYLRRNISASKNVLTQDMMSKENTRYIIQYDYDLGGETINVPDGCVLESDGGSLSNGTIVFNNTEIRGTSNFILCASQGTISNLPSVNMFGIIQKNTGEQNTNMLNNIAVDNFALIFEQGKYIFSESITLGAYTLIKGKGRNYTTLYFPNGEAFVSPDKDYELKDILVEDFRVKSKLSNFNLNKNYGQFRIVQNNLQFSRLACDVETSGVACFKTDYKYGYNDDLVYVMYGISVKDVILEGEIGFENLMLFNSCFERICDSYTNSKLKVAFKNCHFCITEIRDSSFSYGEKCAYFILLENDSRTYRKHYVSIINTDLEGFQRNLVVNLQRSGKLELSVDNCDVAYIKSKITVDATYPIYIQSNNTITSKEYADGDPIYPFIGYDIELKTFNLRQQVMVNVTNLVLSMLDPTQVRYNPNTNVKYVNINTGEDINYSSTVYSDGTQLYKSGKANLMMTDKINRIYTGINQFKDIGFNAGRALTKMEYNVNDKVVYFNTTEPTSFYVSSWMQYSAHKTDFMFIYDISSVSNSIRVSDDKPYFLKKDCLYILFKFGTKYALSEIPSVDSYYNSNI